MKILMICVQPPWPPDGGAPIRSWGWLRTAARGADIGLVSLTGGRPEEQEDPVLAKYCNFVRLVHAPRSTGRRLRDMLLALRTGTPYVVHAARSARMFQAVSAAIDEWRPDIVQAEWLGAAPYLEEARLRGLPSVYAAHNVEHQVVDGQSPGWRRLTARIAANTLLAAETAVARSADLVVTVSEQDKKWFQQLNKQVICIPNAVHPAEYHFRLPSARAKGPVVFVGHLRYPPNLHAARELIRSVFPLIRRQLPETSLVIAGRKPPSRLRRLSGGGVSVSGDIADITTIWNQAAALLSPLRGGGGSRIKLLEAAACGVPIIATEFSARGLMLAPGRDFIAADDATGLAAACVALLRDPERWDGQARQAWKTVEQHHNWDNFTEKIQHLYEGLAHHHR